MKDRGRTNRFVCVLCALANGVPAAAVESFAVLGDDKLAGRVACLIADSSRVGAHVGDQADGSLTRAQVDALVERLGDLHRATNAHLKLPRGLLLQRRGRKRGGRVAPNFAFLDRADPISGAFERPQCHVGFGLRSQLELLAGVRYQLGGKWDVGIGRQRCDPRQERGNAPVFLRNEGADLAFPVDDQLDRHRLHAPRGEPAAHFRPEQRRDFISDEPVENSPGLLCVHAAHIDMMGVFESRESRRFRDLVKLDPLGVGEFEQLRQVPCDRFTLAIGIGCEVDFRRAFYGAPQLLDHVAFAFDRQIARRKIVLYIDPQRALWEVAHVPHRCLHHVSRGKKLLDRPRFRRRFDDDEGLFHGP